MIFFFIFYFLFHSLYVGFPSQTSKPVLYCSGCGPEATIHVPLDTVRLRAGLCSIIGACNHLRPLPLPWEALSLSLPLLDVAQAGDSGPSGSAANGGTMQAQAPDAEAEEAVSQEEASRIRPLRRPAKKWRDGVLHFVSNYIHSLVLYYILGAQSGNSFTVVEDSIRLNGNLSYSH